MVGNEKTTERLLVAGVVLAVVGSGIVAGATVHLRPDEAVQSEQRAVTDDVRPRFDHAARQEATCDYSVLADSLERSVVVVQTSNDTGDVGEGSGWVYEVSNSTALIVTNWHVLFNGNDFDVQFGDGRWREAELVGSSSWTDLAVLRVENIPESVTAMELANGSAERGQPVAALGNPFGLEESISEGLVSGLDRAPTVAYDGGINRTIPDAVQTSAAVNPGNSGGPLVDCRGRVVGTNFAGVGLLDSGVSFALSARMIRHVVPTLVENGTYPAPFVGIVPVSVGPTLAEVNELDVTRGVMVADVLPGGPADGQLQGAPAIHKQTRLPFDGDVILAMDGRPVEDEGDLLSQLYFETRPGETVNFTVLRDGENQTVQVTLGERPTIGVFPQPPTTTPAPPTTQPNATTTTPSTATTTQPTETTTTETTATVTATSLPTTKSMAVERSVTERRRGV